MMAMVLTACPLRRSGCHAVHAVLGVLYCSAQAAATAPPELSTPKPSPDGEKLETAEVLPFVQM
jgi:hypothetical protein